MKVSTETHLRTKVNVEKQVKAPVIELESRVNALDVSSDVWLASTALGLLTSRDQGASWQGGPVLGMGEYLSVAVHGDLMAQWAAGLGFTGVQIPSWDMRLFDLKLAAESQGYCDEVLGVVGR